jgi:Protein of unknown function (DUF3089)
VTGFLATALRLAGALVAVVALCVGVSQAAGSATDSTVWLCRPGQSSDPCTSGLATTVISASGARTTQASSDAASPKFDCFYVYPTVSSETSSNSDLAIQPAETEVAEAQASRFSQVCRVWAPMYRQETLAALLSSSASQTVKIEDVAYASLLSGWRDYLAHDNDGRPIIFIGHSQGASMLIRLLESQVDGNSSLRARMVSAIVLGGNVTVTSGSESGSTFKNIPGCTSSTETGCVIAYSSFPSQPPSDSLFGIPGQGVSIQSGQTATKGLQVLCVNPAALGGGTAALSPYFPTSGVGGASTPWVSFPALYTATCKHSGNTTWLQITDIGSHSDKRPRISEADGPLWGYHTYDVNIALGNLVVDVSAEESAYMRSHH